jgi:hypothetical protein
MFHSSQEFSEFSNVLDSDDETKRFAILQDIDERRKEFTNILDTNKDGKADRSELMLYVDPRHPRFSFQEALTLFNLADKNNDSKLTLDEVGLIDTEENRWLHFIDLQPKTHFFVDLDTSKLNYYRRFIYSFYFHSDEKRGRSIPDIKDDRHSGKFP